MRLGIGWLVMRASTATQRRLKPRALPCVVVSVVAFMGVAAIIGFFVDAKERGQLREYRYATRDIRSFQQALTDVETGVRGFTLSQRADYLEPYSNGMKVLDDLAPVMLPRLDRFDATRPGHQVGTMRPSDVSSAR
jgi:CHASE3 domain sensor protein